MASTASKSAGEEVHTGFPLGDSGRLSETNGVVSVNEADTLRGDLGLVFEVRPDEWDVPDTEAFPLAE